MPRPRVLISDALSPAAVALFKARGIDTDFRPDLGKDKEALASALHHYDGLAIRSTTKVGPKLLAVANGLRVIGRAGSGVDNIDVPAATTRGVVVMNTPFGNSITTAEHTIALMFALARHIPTAAAATRAGRWEKGKYIGVELTGKTLGLIGCGAVGSAVADRAIGLKMRVLAYDPFLSAERAIELGVEKVSLDAIIERSDLISLHTPVTTQTRNILSAEALARTKPGVRIINCARGGLLDEMALVAALDSGHVAGAAIDVLADETNPDSPLLTHPKVVCTPHLGASTVEAQENVALQIAEQMSDYLLRGAITNALNAPSMTAEEAPKLKPFIALADKLGAFGGQIVDGPIERVEIIFEGDAAERNLKALSAAIIAGLLRPVLQTINVVSAPGIARERGMAIDEIVRAGNADYDSLVTLRFLADGTWHELVGTVFHDGKPRIVQIDRIEVDMQFGPQMLYVRNEDRPGFIGRLASAIGDAGLNIATFALGRDRAGGHAIALIEIDGSMPSELLTQIATLKDVAALKLLRF
jgi:D-3-phosphoglycerate dehydrogenase